MKRPAGLPADYMACCRPDGLDGAGSACQPPSATSATAHAKADALVEAHPAARPARR